MKKIITGILIQFSLIAGSHAQQHVTGDLRRVGWTG